MLVPQHGVDRIINFIRVRTMRHQLTMEWLKILILLGSNNKSLPLVREDPGDVLDQGQPLDFSHGIIGTTTVTITPTLARRPASRPFGKRFSIPVFRGR